MLDLVSALTSLTRQPPSLDRKLRHSLAEAAYRTETFRALQRNIDALDAWQLSQIETNKNKEETPIILFSLVTVIYLPLSFMSSVLDMNISDVRNMGGRRIGYSKLSLCHSLLASSFSAFGPQICSVVSRSGFNPICGRRK
jgi:hypothetical protein